MHPALVGVLLAIANVTITGMLIGLSEHAPEAAGAVIVVGMLPGILSGTVIGLIAGATTRSSPAARALLLITLSLFIVAGLGAVVGVLELIPLATVPTVILCVVLERRTRDWDRELVIAETLDADVSLPAPAVIAHVLTPIRLAMLLGAGTTLITMIGCFAGTERTADWFWQGYIPWGFLLGAVLGAPFGGLVEWLAGEPPWTRQVTLLSTVTLLVLALAQMTGPRGYELIVLAAIPAVASCLVLERATRRPDRVPRAAITRR